MSLERPCAHGQRDANLRKICDEHLKGECRVEVIDVTKNPALARGDPDSCAADARAQASAAAEADHWRPVERRARAHGPGPAPTGSEVAMKTRTPTEGSIISGPVCPAFVCHRPDPEVYACRGKPQADLRGIHGRPVANLEVINIYQQPELAKAQEIVVAPTLIKTLPEPVRKILGDLSDKERVLAGLNLQKRAL